jgi:hypothetical protein
MLLIAGRQREITCEQGQYNATFVNRMFQLRDVTMPRHAHGCNSPSYDPTTIIGNAHPIDVLEFIVAVVAGKLKHSPLARTTDL